jgi:hypothetical protein
MTMRKLAYVTTALLCTSLVACGGGKSEQKPDETPAQKGPPVADCVFPDDGKTTAPNWICDFPVPGVAVSAVGIGAASPAGPDHQKTMAEADGRVRLARQFQTRVTNMTKKYVGTTGVGDQQTVDAAAEDVSKLVTDQTLTGSKIFMSRVSPGGTLYVLVGLDPATSESLTKQMVSTSMNNNKALWQQFLAKKAQDELANEIAKGMGEFQGALPQPPQPPQ